MKQIFLIGISVCSGAPHGQTTASVQGIFQRLSKECGAGSEYHVLCDLLYAESNAEAFFFRTLKFYEAAEKTSNRRYFHEHVHHLSVRYRSRFQDTLGTFWSETWHHFFPPKCRTSALARRGHGCTATFDTVWFWHPVVQPRVFLSPRVQFS